MSTSIRLLLDDIGALAEARQHPGAPLADDAIGAIVQLGRALDCLNEGSGGVDRAPNERRGLISRELSASIQKASSAWLTGGGRLTDLAGAAADLSAISVRELSATRSLVGDNWWSGQLAVARAVHRCAAAATRFSPYSSVPALAAVLRLSTMAAQLEQIDPPAVTAWAWLDRDIPGDTAPNRDTALTVPDAAVRLLASAQQELAEGTLHVRALLAVSVAAETLAAGGWPGTAQAGSQAAQGWRVLRVALTHFDDGSRHHRGPSSRASEHAFALHSQVRQLNPKREKLAELSGSLTATRHAVNQLPALAELVGLAVSRRAESGLLFARARALSRTEDRTADLMNDRVVMIRPSDVTAVVFAARATARLSASLALELDRSAGVIGHQPDPGLIAALRAKRRPELNARDAGWAHDLTTRIEATSQPQARPVLLR